MTEPRFPHVPGGYPFPALEQEVLAAWKKKGAAAGTPAAGA